MKELFHHFFLPRESNNHRAKLLHHKTLLVVIVFLFLSSLVVPLLKTEFPQVLGTSIDISAQNLFVLTNKKREEKGLKPLAINTRLSKAAYQKVQDMFEKNYWAHNAPDGVTPWVFIKDAGYEYTYAGENLAKGFTVSKNIVDAWMASQTHRDNILSPNYEDIGLAVVKGRLNGEETVLVVEMFGKRGTFVSKHPIAPELLSSQTTRLARSIKNQPFISSNIVSRHIVISFTLMFILVFILDIIIVERKKIIRLVGHNLDHILFLGVVLLFVVVLSRGMIL